MSSISAPVVVLVIAVSVVAWQIIRRPVSRRFALRNARRRPTESVLVIAGSVLGAALITGSLIVGDTLDASQRATAATQLGPADEMMTLHDAREAARLQRLIVSLKDPRIDGVTTLVTAPAAIASEQQGKTLAEPNAEVVEADFDEARRFGGDPAATGIIGTTPEQGKVVITEDVAGPLDVRAGDQLHVYLYGERLTLEVDRILPRKGIAGFQPDEFRSSSPSVFVTPGTLASVVADIELPEGAMPPHVRVLVSNRGGVEAGAALTEEVSAAIARVLPDDASLLIEPLKQKRLDAAESAGEFYGKTFISVGSFALIAGILLLVSIFVMLAEERKRELGMIRAVGMRRADLVRSFFIEGSVYGLTASAIGAVLGVGIGWLIVRVAAPVFGGEGDSSIELLFAARPASVINGFAFGAIIALLTVFFTSARVSRLNVIRAIRQLPEAKVNTIGGRSIATGLTATLAGATWSIAALSTHSGWQGAIMGPVVGTVGLLPLLSRMIGRKRAVVATATTVLVWGLFGNSITDGRFFDSGEMPAYVAQGVVITFAAVVLVSQFQEALGKGLRRLAGGFLSLRLATAYPISNRLRTDLTLLMYSLVIFTLVFVASLAAIFSGEVDRLTKDLAGGFDIVVTASPANPPDLEKIESAVGSSRVVPAVSGAATFDRKGKKPQRWWATGIDGDFIAAGVPVLAERAPEFSNDRQAWAALLDDPGTVIIPPLFMHVGGDMAKVPAPGDVVRTIDPTTGIPRNHRVIGILDDDPTNMGAVMAKETLAESAHGTTSASRFYVDLDGSSQGIAAAAERLEGAFVENGVDAASFRSLAEDSMTSSIQFLRLIQGFLALGLIVGIAGLGVVMVRAVRERRQDVGALRSIGFLASRVRRAFVLESAFVAFEGIAIGAVLGLATASQLAATGDLGKGATFAIPWLEVFVLGGSALLASMVATAWPALQAARIPPATALRITD